MQNVKSGVEAAESSLRVGLDCNLGGFLSLAELHPTSNGVTF